MNSKVAVAIVTVALIAACGKDDSGLNKNKGTPTAATTTQADDSTIHSGAVPSSDSSDDAPVVTKKKKKAVKKAPVAEPVVAEAPAPTADALPVAVAPSPSPVPTPVPQDAVVGLGSAGQKPEELMARGYGFAVADARFCSVSGKFTNGVRCYAVFQNGNTKWVDSSTHDAIEAFIVQLQAKADAEKGAKAERKSDKQKKGKLHWLKKLVP